MNTNQTTPRKPKLGDIVQFGVGQPGLIMGPMGTVAEPVTPYPAIVVHVHDPNDPQSSLDITVFGAKGTNGASSETSTTYSPTLAIGTWSWIE